MGPHEVPVTACAHTGVPRTIGIICIPLFDALIISCSKLASTVQLRTPGTVSTSDQYIPLRRTHEAFAADISAKPPPFTTANVSNPKTVWTGILNVTKGRNVVFVSKVGLCAA